jgi:hypothetical protein
MRESFGCEKSAATTLDVIRFTAGRSLNGSRDWLAGQQEPNLAVLPALPPIYFIAVQTI